MERTKLVSPPNQESPRRRDSQRRLIQLAIVISTLATVVLLGGFGYGTYIALGGSGAQHRSITPTTSSNPGTSSIKSGKNIHLVAIGDSLAHGLGDASGRGFVGDVSQQYRSKGYTIIQSNLGVDGQTSEGLLSEVHKASVQNLVHSANVILISIGGNDLNNTAGLPNINKEKIAGAQVAFSTNLTEILTVIRKVNPESPIFVVGLYNPYDNIASARTGTDLVIQNWNAREEEIVAKFPKTVLVQTFDLFELHDDQLLYLDHFHPNENGYYLIAERIWQDIQGANGL